MEAQQQYHYQYQQQPSVETTLTLSNNPSQTQQQPSYDQSSASYYASYYQYPYNTQSQDYASYYYQQQQQQNQDYSNSYQATDPNQIHPPGVPLTVDSQQTQVSDPQNLYYQHGVMASQPASHQGFYPAGVPQAGRGGRGRGAFGRHGRGRGGGRGKPQTSKSAASSSTDAASNKPPSRMAWCEVCRTDCTTLEVLEQHKNGKKHKKNLKLQAELMGLGKQLTNPNPETAPPQNAEVSNPDNLTPASSENPTDKPEQQSQESTKKDHIPSRGGFKRPMRGGRGGKWMRAFDGSRRLVEPPKPKQVVPLICELCNVKCESQVVFQSHITGKKHITNMKRFQAHKETLGDGIQALYPSISHLLPSTSIISQGPQDAQTLASMILSQQNLPDPQGAQAALTQLLQQHGIHDAQTLIAQLVPYLLAQQVPAQNPVSQEGAPVPVGTESLNVGAENQTEQQDVTANAGSEVDSGTNDKPATVEPENENQS